MRNGYEVVYMPEHHRADSTGYVYEHIIIAEQKLGRLLKDEECVHHKNETRNDNRPENLIVFKTNADHISFHKGCEIVQEGDVYIALPHKKSICPLCGGVKDFSAKTCINCCNILKRKVELPSRDELKKMIFNNSFLQIGNEYNVSYNAVKKWCKKYNLPHKKSEIKKYTIEEWNLI